MNKFGNRLTLIGALLLAIAGAYVATNLKSETEIKIDQISINVRNNALRLKMISVGSAVGALESRSAKQIYEEQLRIAYWPTGFGLLFLLLGWAASAGNERNARNETQGD